MRIGLVCRFKPLHRTHAALLEAVCRRADHAVVGIGSANRYDLRNPFSAAESAAMVAAVLRPAFANASLVPMPDLGHGPRWRALVVARFGALDLFVSANAYVRRLLEGTYPLAHPMELVPPGLRRPISGTAVRLAMARGEPWQDLVPVEVARYMEQAGLPERFRREFGLPTIARALVPSARADRPRAASGTAPARAPRDEEEHNVLLGR